VTLNEQLEPLRQGGWLRGAAARGETRPWIVDDERRLYQMRLEVHLENLVYQLGAECWLSGSAGHR